MVIERGIQRIATNALQVWLQVLAGEPGSASHLLGDAGSEEDGAASCSPRDQTTRWSADATAGNCFGVGRSVAASPAVDDVLQAPQRLIERVDHRSAPVMSTAPKTRRVVHRAGTDHTRSGQGITVGCDKMPCGARAVYPRPGLLHAMPLWLGGRGRQIQADEVVLPQAARRWAEWRVHRPPSLCHMGPDIGATCRRPLRSAARGLHSGLRRHLGIGHGLEASPARLRVLDDLGCDDVRVCRRAVPRRQGLSSSR